MSVTPTVPTGTPAVAIPDYAFPFTFDASTGLVGVVEKGSYEDQVASVLATVVCSIGQCPELPTFGVPDPTFGQAPPDANALLAAIQKWVPGANEEAVVSALDTSGAAWQIALNTPATGTGQ